MALKIETIKVVVIDDDKVVIKNLEKLLSQRGHAFAGSATNAQDGIALIKSAKPHVIICDIALDGAMDGIDMIKLIPPQKRPPVIYLTAHNEQTLYEKAKRTNPHLYMTKPVDPDTLDRNIQLAVRNKYQRKFYKGDTWDRSKAIKGAFFTKIGNKLKKLQTDDVNYIEVEGKYCAIVMKDKRINAKISLKDFLRKLPEEEFARVSRNYIVNINKIETIDTNTVTVKIAGQDLPISRTYKEDLFRRINLV